MKNVYLTEEDLISLSNILDYGWKDEYKDYNESDEDRKKDHMFHHYDQLRKILKSVENSDLFEKFYEVDE